MVATAPLKTAVVSMLFLLTAIAVVMTYYFTAKKGSSGASFKFVGTDDSGATVTLVSRQTISCPWYGFGWCDSSTRSTVVDFEITTGGSNWQKWRSWPSQNSGEQSNAFFFLYNDYQSNEWTCTLTGNGNSNANNGGYGNVDTFGYWGAVENQKFTAAGGIDYWAVYSGDTFVMALPVVFSSAGITNFGGYFGTTTFGSFSLPSITLPSFCSYEDTTLEAAAVVESTAAPLCSSFPSLFAFLQQRSYADSAAATFCSGSATASTCTATIAKTDTVLAWKGTDRAFSCSNASYGTILTVSGSDDLTDWLRNLTITSKSWNGMTTHNGFLTKYNMWASQYTSWIGSATTITFNGHSLGGAIQTLAAVAQKTASPSNTINIVTAGCPAAFKTPHSSTFTGLSHKRHVNFEKKPWYLPNQRDVVSAVTGVVGYSHASTHPILGQTLNGGSWSNSVTSVTAVVGDVQISLHTTYTTSLDAVSPVY